MKKIIAILLSVICLFSAVSVNSLAVGDILGDIIEDQFGITEEEGAIEDVLSYGIHYEMKTLSLVSVIYTPNPTITFKAPCMARVTLDTPLSIDYQFVCWEEKESGKYYYPGDDIEVTGIVTLYAIWEEKTDNHPYLIRMLATMLDVIKHYIDKLIGAYDAFDEFESEYVPTTAPATTVPETTVEA